MAEAKNPGTHSEAYYEAKKEFNNCLWMSLIGLGVPLVLAFKEWRPIMREELRKEKEALAAGQPWPESAA